eukprot:2677694-Prymnesium_polylepis.1
MHAPGKYPRDADTWTRTGKVWSEDCHRPARCTSFDFKKELDSFEFTLAELSVLARLAYIEQFMHKQQQAG